jgi:hypothetical protein
MAGSGTYTEALGAGGDDGSSTLADAELWNGTNWAEQANLSQARRALAGTTSGGSTAALAFGGEAPPLSVVTDKWAGAGSPTTVTFTDS